MMIRLPVFQMVCEYRSVDAGVGCANTIGGDVIPQPRDEVRRSARAAGWATGNPAWHRRKHGPGHRVDLCPSCAQLADVDDVRPRRRHPANSTPR